MYRECTCRIAPLVFVANLVLGAACGGRPDFGEDGSPPELAFVGEAPVAARETIITLTMSAADPSGISGVWCQFGNGAPVAAEQGEDGNWSCGTSSLTVNGSTAYTVWAADGSKPPNNGQFSDAPYRLSGGIVVDQSTPQVTLDALVSYVDERGLRVGVGSDGRALVPAVYSFDKKNAPTLAPGGEIWKVATRLGWTTQPSAADLESPERNAVAGNFPTLRFAVPWNAQANAPISSATYSVTVGSGPSATGALWPAAKTDPNVLYFDLPLSSNLFPDLAGITGGTDLNVSVAFTNVVGSTGSGSFGPFHFHVLGPPLAVVEDVGYASAGDAKSTYPYRLSGGTYAALYDGSANQFAPENSVRLVRYVITNPAPQPVALAASIAGGSWSAVETWVGGTWGCAREYYSSGPCAQVRGEYCNGDGRRYGHWDCFGPNCECSARTVKQFPCVLGAAQCGHDDVGGVEGEQTRAGLGTAAYDDQDAVAARTARGRYVVPRASATTPGALSLFVVRSRSDLPARGVTITDWNGAQVVQDLGDGLRAGERFAVTVECACSEIASCGPCKPSESCSNAPTLVWCMLADGSRAEVWRYARCRYGRELTAAEDRVAGTLRLDTWGLTTGSEVGEVTGVGSFHLAQTIAH